MRRALAISLVLFFTIGPLSALIGDSEDAGIPACCRRLGAHHCAMAASLAAIVAASTGGPLLRSPATCPNYPNAPAATPSAQALIASSVSLPELLVQLHSIPATQAAARISQIRARDSRGPPISA